MGLCSSKPAPISAPTSNSNRIAAAQRAPASRPAGIQNKKSPRTQQPGPKRKRTKKKTKTTTAGRPLESTNSERAKRSTKVANKSSVGQTVSDATDDNKQRLSPREAARLAAEKRLQETNEKSTKGELGKKLAQERRKSTRTRILEETQGREAERNNTPLIYD